MTVESDHPSLPDAKFVVIDSDPRKFCEVAKRFGIQWNARLVVRSGPVMDSDGNIVPDPVGWRRYQSGDRWICSYRAKVDLGNGLAAVASEHILEDELNIDQDRGKQAIENIVADRIRSLQAMHS